MSELNKFMNDLWQEYRKYAEESANEKRYYFLYENWIGDKVMTLTADNAKLTASLSAWKAIAEELTHPKHAYRYYCMWCGNLLVNIGHSPDCPITKLEAMKAEEK